MIEADFSILDAMDSPHVWRGWFRDATTWEPWRGFLSALFGLPMSGGMTAGRSSGNVRAAQRLRRAV